MHSEVRNINEEIFCKLHLVRKKISLFNLIVFLLRTATQRDKYSQISTLSPLFQI